MLASSALAADAAPLAALERRHGGRLGVFVIETAAGRAMSHRAALPKDWRAGDKTGTGDAYTTDVVILRPPGRSLVIARCYYESSATTVESREAVLREVGAAIVAWIG